MILWPRVFVHMDEARCVITYYYEDDKLDHTTYLNNVIINCKQSIIFYCVPIIRPIKIRQGASCKPR